MTCVQDPLGARYAIQKSVAEQRHKGCDVNRRRVVLGSCAAGTLAACSIYPTFHEVSWTEEIELHDFDVTASPQILAERGRNLKSQVSAGITYDSRNRVYLPNTGWRVDAQMYVAGGFLGGDEEIYGFDIDASK